MPKVIQHDWKNGGDNVKLPTISQLENGHWLIVSDADCDADGSPRATQIDPSCGQGETSLRRSNGWKGKEQYVNSETIPFYVLPLNWSKVTGEANSHMGDIAKLTYKDKVIYAIWADQGPSKLIGEASICAIEKLGFNPWNKEKTKVYCGIPHGVTYEVIPGSADLSRTIDIDSIQAYGKELFENQKPVPQPQISSDFSIKFLHLKNIKADLALTKGQAQLLWEALRKQSDDKNAFNMRVNIGTKPEYGNAQCAVTTASVLEGAALLAGMNGIAELFSKKHRDNGEFALTHQIEIMLKRLGFVMYDKSKYWAPRGAIALMEGRYAFAGCEQHSGHVYTMHIDQGVGQKDIINDNGGFEHLYNNLTESFFVPEGITVNKRDEQLSEPKECAKLLIAEAKKWVGVHEIGGNNRGSQVEIFQKAVDGKASGEAWCMAFVQFCIKQVEQSQGIKSSIIKSEHCMTTWRGSEKSRCPAQPGSVIIWRHGTTDNGHTGIVVSVNADGSINTIEGNTSDGTGVNRDGDGVYSRKRNAVKEGDMIVQGFLKPF